MIIDKVNGQPVPRYLIYDIIKFNVSSSTKECIAALWPIQSPKSQCGYNLSGLRGVFFLSGHWKFHGFSQDLYPFITKTTSSQEMALSWNGGVYWEMFETHFCLSS